MFLPNLSNTGPNIVAKDLCTGLVRNGHVCQVFYFDDIVELDMPCSIERITNMKRFDFSNWDIIHSHMFRPDLYIRLHTLFSRKKHRTRFISTLHNPISYRALKIDYPLVHSLIGSFLWKFALRAFNELVVLNEDTYQQLSKVSKEHLHIIHNGRDIIPSAVSNEKDLEEIRKLKQKYIIVGTVSRIIKRKGIEQMIRALVLLPNYAFVVVGDGSELENIKILAKELSVSERCYWVGYREDATSYQSLFDLFVMCSRSEGFPLALIEAAGYGVPSILSDISIFKSIMTEREVLFYKLDNIDSLVSAIHVATRNREKFANRIYDYYIKNLTVNSMTDKYLELYIHSLNS